MSCALDQVELGIALACLLEADRMAAQNEAIGLSVDEAEGDLIIIHGIYWTDLSYEKAVEKP